MNIRVVVLNIPIFSSLSNILATVYEKGRVCMCVYVYVHKCSETYISDPKHMYKYYISEYKLCLAHVAFSKCYFSLLFFSKLINQIIDWL